MNQEVKAKWIDALRSGEYEQGKWSLKNIENEVPKYCCLGVLCDLYIKETGRGKWVENNNHELFVEGHVRNGGYLTEPVMKWAGLHEHNPVIGYTNASFYNDSPGESFKEIADLIEQNL